MASSRSRAPKALAQSTGESVIIGLFTSPELLDVYLSANGLDKLRFLRFAWAASAWPAACSLTKINRAVRNAVLAWRSRCRLISLRMIWRTEDYVTIDDNALNVCARDCTSMRVLELNATRLTNAAVQNLAVRCPLLEELFLNDGDHLGNPAFLSIGRNCTSLTTLNLSNIPLTAIGATALVVGCQRLRKLSLWRIGDLPADLVQALPSLLPDLRDLRLGHLTGVTTEVLANTHWPKLENLDLSWLSDGAVSVTSAFPVAPMLKKLHLSYRGQPEPGNQDVHTLRHLNTRCPLLKDFKVSGRGDIDLRGLSLPQLALLEISQFDTDGSALADAQLPSLKRLKMFRLTRASDDSVSRFASALTNLHELHFDDLSNVGDTAMAALAQHCSKLRFLDIMNTSVSDQGMAYIATLPLLETLCIMYVEGITDCGLACLHSHSSLAHLCMSYHNQVTDAGLLALARSCPALVELDWDWDDEDEPTAHVSQEGVEKAVAVVKARKKAKKKA